MVVLILGATGQDGSYLCDHYLNKGWTVFGVSRKKEYPYLKIKTNANFTYISFDLSSENGLKEILKKANPDIIHYTAAIHGSFGFDYEGSFDQLMNVNIRSLQRCLDFCKKKTAASQLVYFSSRKVFGDELIGTISESTPKLGNCLYSFSKLSAEKLIEYYKVKYKINASILYLFNHESDRRPADFFSTKLANALSLALKGNKEKTTFYSLNFWSDWGAASEFMEIVSSSSQSFDGNYIFATGKTIYAVDLVREVFDNYGLDFEDYIETTIPIISKKATSLPFVADINKLKRETGKYPKILLKDLIFEIIEKEI